MATLASLRALTFLGNDALHLRCSSRESHNMKKKKKKMTSASFLPRGLSEIIASRQLLDAFHEFTAEMFCEENLQFVEEVIWLKAARDPTTINGIFLTYIASNSPLQVNIDDIIRTVIMQRLDARETMGLDELLCVFDEAAAQVAEQLERNCVPRFLQQQGKRYVTLPFFHLSPFQSFFHFRGSQFQPDVEVTQPSLLHPSANPPTWYRGHLLRRKGFFGGWSPFTYSKKGSYLFEYKPGAHPLNAKPLATIHLDGSLVEPAHALTGKLNTFTLHTMDGNTYFFQADSKEDMERWMKELCVEGSLTSQLRERAMLSPPVMDLSSQQATSSSAQLLNNERGEAAPQGSFFTPEELTSIMPVFNFVFLDTVEEAAVAADHTGKIVAFNRAAEQMFGFPRAEAIGSSVKILMPEPYRSLHDGYMFRHEKSGEDRLIGKPRAVLGQRKTGEVFKVVISLGRLPLPGFYIAAFTEEHEAI